MKANFLITFNKFFLGLGLLALIVACNSGSYKDDVPLGVVDVSEDFETVAEKPISSSNSINPEPEHLKIIKSANVRYKVKDVKKATQRVKQITRQFSAYISDLRFENDLYRKENRFTIKVPQEHFDQIMDSIAVVAEFIEFENITSKDVTEEYVDLQARLSTKLEVKERYEDILRKKAVTVEDILSTEEKLRIIQEEIESAQGRLKYLSNKVSYSTIQVDLYETVTYTEEPESYTKTFWNDSKESLQFGWNLLKGLILALMHIWPLLIAGTFLYFFIRRKMKK